MQNIWRGDFSAKIKGWLSYNFLFKFPSPPSYSQLTSTLLSLWPPEIGTHFQPPSWQRLTTFICLRPASTDIFNPYPAHKSPLLLLFTMEGPTKAFRGCTFLVYLLLSSISLKKKKKKNYLKLAIMHYSMYLKFKILITVLKFCLYFIFHNVITRWNFSNKSSCQWLTENF